MTIEQAASELKKTADKYNIGDRIELKKLALAYAFEEVKRTSGNISQTAEEIYQWLIKDLK